MSEVYVTRNKSKNHSGPFVAVSVEFITKVLPHLRPTTAKVALFLATKTSKDGKILISLRKAAKDLGVSRNTLTAAVEELEGILFRRVDENLYLADCSVEEALEQLLKRSKKKSGSKIGPANGSKTEPPVAQKLSQGGAKTEPQHKNYGKKDSLTYSSSDEEEVRSFVRRAPNGRTHLLPSDLKEEELLVSKKEFDPEWRTSAREKARLLGNSILDLVDIEHLPDTYLPPTELPESLSEEEIKASVLLRATNVICAIQKWNLRSSQMYLPVSRQDLAALGHVLAHLLGEYDWDLTLEKFYKWVINNKERLDYRLLPYYYSDWSSELLSLRRRNV